MSRVLESSEVAVAAARRAGVEIVLLDDLDEMAEASGLFAEIWGLSKGTAQLPPDIFRALTHAGNYAAGAYRDGHIIGAIAGFLGRDGDGTYLHSHILGVSADHRSGHVGFALKQHQRAWAAEAGLSKITWTFDPLVRRNAYFNLHKLGSCATTYHESFYGEMSDDVNAGDESDRLLIVWDVRSKRADEAAAGSLPDIDVDELIARGASVALAAGDNGDPVVLDARSDTLLCATPPDVVDLRTNDFERSLRWRHALRKTLGGAMDDDYEVTGFARSGWYVLTRTK